MPSVLGIGVGGGDAIGQQPGGLLGLHGHVLAATTAAGVLGLFGDAAVVLPTSKMI